MSFQKSVCIRTLDIGNSFLKDKFLVQVKGINHNEIQLLSKAMEYENNPT